LTISGDRQPDPIPPRIGRIGGIRLPAAQREAANHRYAPRSKDDGLREPDATTAAFEESGNAHAFGVIASETRVNAIDVLKTIHKPPGRQIVRREPPAQIGERS
jgi:hypothetical protein